MFSKIITFNKAKEIIKPNRATLISGSFEPFNSYYFSLLSWAAKQNRPLIVLVQKDDMVMHRRGLCKLSSTHKIRASRIAALEFVDYVIIANKTSHDDQYLQILKPRLIVFPVDNLKYRKILEKIIKKNYPKIKIKYSPYSKNGSSAAKKIHLLPIRNIGKITKKLIELSIKSKGKFSKISAILTNAKGKIILKAANSNKEEHAEILLIRLAKKKKINLSSCAMYILIPPCIMCAESIFKNRIRKIYYALSYGDKKGVEYLIAKGIIVKSMNQPI